MKNTIWRCGNFFIQGGEPVAILLSAVVRTPYHESENTDLSGAARIQVIDTDPRTALTYPPIYSWDGEALMWLARRIVSKFDGLTVVANHGSEHWTIDKSGEVQT